MTTDQETPDPEQAPEPEQTNSAAMSALMDQLMPPDEREMSEAEAPPAEIKRISALAQDPKLGEVFTIGGEEFHRQFLTIDAEQRLIAIVKEVLTGAVNGNLIAGFLSRIERVTEACALILSDQRPECDEAWLRGRPRDTLDAVTTNRMMGVVVAQMHLNETTLFLTELLALVGLAGRFSGPRPGG